MSWLWQPIPSVTVTHDAPTCGYFSMFAFWLGGAGIAGVTFQPFFFTPQQTVYRM